VSFPSFSFLFSQQHCTCNDKKIPSSVNEVEENVRRNIRRTLGQHIEIHLLRVAIGEMVFSARCKMRIQLGTSTPYILLSFARSSDEEWNEEKLKIPLTYESITEMKYYLDDDSPGDSSGGSTGDACSDDQITFIAMKVVPNKENKLECYKDSYGQKVKSTANEDKRGTCGKEFCKGYIVLEIRNDADFKEKLPTLRENNEILQVFLGNDSKVSPSESEKYIFALREHSERERVARLATSPRTTRRRSRLGTTGPNAEKRKVILVYPFVGGDDVEKAAEGLMEEMGDIVEYSEDGIFHNLSAADQQLSTEQLQAEATSGRTHFLSITREDRDRLEPGEFLNDTLVDFWMRW